MTPAEQREAMVRDQIAARGVRDPRVLAAMRDVPRERFVGPSQIAHAYEDRPVPIGFHQTLSQPYIVARMCELARLAPGHRVLEIGAGSGYQTAVLSCLAADVFAVEIIPQLAELATRRLRDLGIRSVHVECFDGTYGWPAHAPFDAIIVSAGAPRIPPLLLSQLVEGGRLVIPQGPRDGQRLVVATRRGDDVSVEDDGGVRFVDLVGKYGWGGSGAPSA